MIPERRMNMKNDDKIREQLNSEPVPDRLKPENIKIMLDNEAPKQKRKGITVSRIAASVAACAVIGGSAVYYTNNDRLSKNDNSVTVEPNTNNDIKTTDGKSSAPELKKQFNYMSGADDYEQIYTMFKDANDKAKKSEEKTKKFYQSSDEVMEMAEESAVADAEFSGSNDVLKTDGDGIGGMGSGEPTAPETPVISTNGTADEESHSEPATAPAAENEQEPSSEENNEPENDPEHSDTYYQEQDVLEADIVKTDGKHIYYLGRQVDENAGSPVLRVADVKDGKFTSSTSVNIMDAFDEGISNYSIDVRDMYIYNDMIAIIGTNYNSLYSLDEDEGFYGSYSGSTFVAFYTTGDTPELIDVYTQGGYYDDVRISPDGHMLLLSDYTTCSFEEIGESDNEKRYIPSYGCRNEIKLVPAEDILLPIGGFDDSGYSLSYTVIGSIDLNESGAPKAYDIKSLAGYSGSIYCSADNLYTSSFNWGENTSDITRISIAGGNIDPVAGGTINGEIKDQFSMSEYNGYFRVAATYNETKKEFHRFDDDDDSIPYIFWDRITNEDGEEGYYTYETVKTDTRVYVMDMDMNIVGSVSDLGVGEQLKSASFSGNMAYVVTFRQTDPLYAVDLSEPENPVVLDEFKINGFSTYMQSWGDGLLLGFGQDADDDGRITGLRLTMFDNSDPNDLKAADVVTWNNKYFEGDDIRGQSETYYGSTATYERKALLIAPEKNIIGVPIVKNDYNYDNDYSSEFSAVYQYVFFKFEDGKFVEVGDVSTVLNGWDDYNMIASYDRAVYIGDYVYVLSSNKFVAADINTLEVSDELNF